jgi:putative transposase
MNDDTPSPLGNVITIDDERIKSHLDRVVRGSVEETLNALLDAEADRLCNAQRYERSAARRDTRAGHYERNLQTKAGEVRLRVPKLRQQTFETAIIERYRRRESSVEESVALCDRAASEKWHPTGLGRRSGRMSPSGHY